MLLSNVFSLTVNDIWEGCLHPPDARFFVKNICIFYAYDFLAMYLQFYWLTFKKILGCSCSRELSCDLFSTGCKRKFAIFEDFRGYLRKFSIFFHEIVMVARSYQVLATHIRSLLIGALVGLETRLKSLDFCHLLTIFAIFEAVVFDASL